MRQLINKILSKNKYLGLIKTMGGTKNKYKVVMKRGVGVFHIVKLVKKYIPCIITITTKNDYSTITFRRMK